MLTSAQITIRDANDIIASPSAPANPVADMLWLNTSASPSVLMRWTGLLWETVNDTAPLAERISQAEQRITDEAIIQTVTTSESYQSLSDSVGGVVNTANAAQAAASEAQEAALEAMLAVDELSVGARNWLRDTGQSHTKSSTGGTNDSSDGYHAPAFPSGIAVGDSYIVSADVFVNATFADGARIQLQGPADTVTYDEYNWSIHAKTWLEGCMFTDGTRNGGVNIDLNTYAIILPGSGQTVHVEMRYKLTQTQYDAIQSGTLAGWYVGVRCDGDNGSLTLSNVKLEWGSKATDWTPAPEDFQIDMNNVERRMTTAEQKITAEAIVSTVRSSTQYRGDVYNGRNYVLNSHIHATFSDNKYQYANGVQTTYASVSALLSGDLYEHSAKGAVIRISFDIKRTNIATTNSGGIYTGVWVYYDYVDTDGTTKRTSRGWYLRTTDSDFVATDGDWVRVKKGPMSLASFSPTAFPYFAYGTASASGTTGTVVFRNVKVETSNVFTDWTPAPEDMSGLPERVEAAESSITQHSNLIALKVSTSTYDAEKVYRGTSAPANPVHGMLWLDIGQTPNLLKRCDASSGEGWEVWTVVGTQEVKASGVYIGPDKVEIESENVVITVPGAGEQLRIDSDGVCAQTISSPSVVSRYTGSSMIIVNPSATPDGKMFYCSLADVFSMLKNKFFSSVSIFLMGGGSLTIGDLSLTDACGRIGISDMSSMELIGTLTFRRCSYVSLGIILRANSASKNSAIDVDECPEFECIGSTITGSGTMGIRLGKRTRANIESTQIRGFTDAINTAFGCTLYTGNLSGTGYVRVNGSVLMAYGTLPSGGIFNQSNSLVASTGSSTSGGSGTVPATPTISTATYNATVTRTYRRSAWVSESGLLQGYTSGNSHHYACIWFDNATLRSNLSGKTIAAATLTLRRIGGYGRGSAVNVYLHGLVNSGASGAPSLSGNYGLIGAIEPTNVLTFTIPTGIVSALRGGTIQGFCLYTGETSTISGEAYSRHYAAFTAVGGTNIPVLTVTYQ